MRKIGGFLTLGVLGCALALTVPATAKDRTSPAYQPKADSAITQAQAARDVLVQKETSSDHAAMKQARFLDRANRQLERANRQYAAGRFYDAARSAGKASRLMAHAQTDQARTESKPPKEVQ